MELGQVLFEAGHRTAVALAWNAFADGPGMPPRKVRGDFNWQAAMPPGSPNEASLFARRYGFAPAGVEGGSKGSVDGGERKMDLPVLADWVRQNYPKVDEINALTLSDVFFVEDGDGTVYSKQVYPWLLQRNLAAPVPGRGADVAAPIDDKVSRIEGKVEALATALSALTAQVAALASSTAAALARIESALAGKG